MVSKLFHVQCDELKEIVTDEHMPWISQYLVMKRVSIEPNFHLLYSNFLDVMKWPELTKQVTYESFRNIRVILFYSCAVKLAKTEPLRNPDCVHTERFL